MSTLNFLTVQRAIRIVVLFEGHGFCKPHQICSTPCRQDSALHSLELPPERAQLVLGVATVMEGMVHDAMQYRVGKATLYQSYVSTESAEPEFLPWTGADVYRVLILDFVASFLYLIVSYPGAPMWPGNRARYLIN